MSTKLANSVYLQEVSPLKMKVKSASEYPIYSEDGKLFCMRKVDDKGEVMLEGKNCSLSLMSLQTQALNPAISTLHRCKGNRKRNPNVSNPRQSCDMATTAERSTSTEGGYVQAVEPNHIE